MSKTITVGIADLNAVRSPDVLVTYALGSCAGICLYDSATKIAGLAHILLPSSSMSRNMDLKEAMKFADTGIVLLVKKMEGMGAHRANLKAKIAGGAKMFAFKSASSDLGNIGARNVQSVKQTLAQLHIPIIAEDTGKDYGRTVFFYGENGAMKVKSVKKGEWVY